MKKRKIKILLIDSHLLFREAISNFLSKEKRFQIIDEHIKKLDALESVRKLNPDIVLLNVDIKKTYAAKAIFMILNINPLIKIIALSLHNSPDEANVIMGFGAKGYVTKTSEINEFKVAILEVEKGNNYICSEIRKMNDFPEIL